MQKKGVALETVHTEIELHKPENKNVTWLNHPATWVSYIIIICLGRFAFYAIGFDSVTSWTLWHISHALVTMWAIHWVKGNPLTPLDASESGKYDRLTLWEQIDNGVQFTPTRKFLIIVPIIMFFLTSHYTNRNLKSVLINTIAFVAIEIAKLPYMAKKRIFGINR